jgi:hypothetical protein
MSRDIKCYAYYPVLLSNGSYIYNQVYWIVNLNVWFGTGPRTRLLSDQDYLFHLLAD